MHAYTHARAHTQARVFFDGKSIVIDGPASTHHMLGPKLAVHGFSRYLPGNMRVYVLWGGGGMAYARVCSQEWYN